MNGQTNENQPVRPDFSGSTLPPIGGSVPSTGGPAPLNTGGAGFGNQPVSSEWSPNTVPTPGPIGGAPSAVPISPSGGSMSSIPAGVSGNPVVSPPPTPITAAPNVNMTARPVPPITTPTPAASVPPPSASAYEVRTLNSDAQGMRASGGMEAAPRTFTPAPMSGEAFFNPAAPATPAKKKEGSKAILIIGIVIIVAGLGVLGYIFGKPLFTTPIQTPESLPPAIPPEETIPEELPPEETPAVHSSYFTAASADMTEEYSVESVTLESLKALFPLPKDATASDNAIRELVISSAGIPITFSEFLSVMLPDLNAPGIAATFEDDFTLFVYEDGTNNLSGFIAKVKTDVAPETLASVSSALEASPNLANFYLTDPGTKSAFRDGTVTGGKPVRYAPFSTAGYAWNYGWFKDASDSSYLVVASSYKGITEAVARAGF
ncbi:MAG: hypothetical protein WC519_01165 [Parcubacteria group bacterium]